MSTPQAACLLQSQSVADDLVNEGGIMDLWVREARLFKYGLRVRLEFLEDSVAKAEALSGGGPFLGADELFCESATAPPARSSPGGTTRRRRQRWSSSTSTTPISRTFIDWKVVEEQKSCPRFVAGSKARGPALEPDHDGVPRGASRPGRRTRR